MSLTQNVWQKHPLCLFLRFCASLAQIVLGEGISRTQKSVFSTTALEAEEAKQLPALPVLSEDTNGGLAEGQRTGAGRYHRVAPAAALHQPRLHDSHSQADLSTGESSSDQQDRMANVKV